MTLPSKVSRPCPDIIAVAAYSAESPPPMPPSHAVCRLIMENLPHLTSSMVTGQGVTSQHWQASYSESGSAGGSRPGAYCLLQWHSEAQAACSCTIHAAAAAARAGLRSESVWTEA